jgi:uncharacterized protein (TIGR01568 family)
MNSWFHRLRRKRTGAGAIANAAAAEPPPPPPCSPNRASYYVPSRDRAVPRRPDNNPKLRDTQFPRSPQASDVVARSSPAPELKLRPILTRAPPRPDDGGGAAASPTGRARPPPGFHHAATPDRRRRNKAEEEACTRRACGLRRAYEGLVVVVESADPEEDFLESMAEMATANGVRSPRGLEELLACYLALNAADHHRAIVAAFRRAWMHLHLLRRCMHEHESCVVAD